VASLFPFLRRADSLSEKQALFLVEENLPDTLQNRCTRDLAVGHERTLCVFNLPKASVKRREDADAIWVADIRAREQL
jgi:hypothetical protein